MAILDKGTLPWQGGAIQFPKRSGVEGGKKGGFRQGETQEKWENRKRVSFLQRAIREFQKSDLQPHERGLRRPTKSAKKKFGQWHARGPGKLAPLGKLLCRLSFWEPSRRAGGGREGTKKQGKKTPETENAEG